jgi:hypothetical protein
MKRKWVLLALDADTNQSTCMGVFYSSQVKVKFTSEQAMKAQWGSRGIAVLFL